jgi:putative ABC transport system substrate-binding protein
MRRRDFLGFFAGAAGGLCAPTVRAQTSAPVRIGFLITGSLAENVSIVAFRQAMNELGYTEGKSYIIEPRTAEGRIEQLPRLAKELVASRVDIIVTAATPGGQAAQRATDKIPIVVAAMGEPVGDGLVASLARPGGNLTGTTFLGPALVPKRFAFLKQLLPGVSRIAILSHPTAFSAQTTADMLKETTNAGASLGMQLQFVEVRSPDDLVRAFSEIARLRAEALFPLPSTMLFSERKRIVDLAAASKLPGMYNSREFVEIGGLIGYGANLADLSRRSAGYVDRILKGAKPADLPVEQPTKFELLINMKTAKALGITVPLVLQQVADEIID